MQVVAVVLHVRQGSVQAAENMMVLVLESMMNPLVSYEMTDV